MIFERRRRLRANRCLIIGVPIGSLCIRAKFSFNAKKSDMREKAFKSVRFREGGGGIVSASEKGCFFSLACIVAEEFDGVRAE